ncbi:hypothetical protein [Gymnodinialimonas hymeniacidonis]|uniref:hypothetical protein n=1 Tax=Gymnodinialimonas hymeniacidonis TaxID=3126508 RepID=UPI0034C5C5D7
MPGVGWITILTVLPGLLAFGLSRRFGARAGWIVVGCVALLNLPNVIGHVSLLIGTPETSGSAFEMPGDATIGAGGYLMLGTFLFVFATLVSAILGAVFGARGRQEAVE